MKRFIKSTNELRIFFPVVYFKNTQRSQSELENCQTDSIKWKIFRDESLILSGGSPMSFSNIKTGTKIARLAPLIYFTASRCHGGSVSGHLHVVVSKCKQVTATAAMFDNKQDAELRKLSATATLGNFLEKLHKISTAIYYLKFIFSLSFRRAENIDIKKSLTTQEVAIESHPNVSHHSSELLTRITSKSNHHAGWQRTNADFHQHTRS